MRYLNGDGVCTLVGHLAKDSRTNLDGASVFTMMVIAFKKGVKTSKRS